MTSFIKKKYSRLSLPIKLSLFITLCIFLTFFTVLYYNFHTSRKLIINDVENITWKLAGSLISETNRILSSSQQIADDFVTTIEATDLSDDQIIALMKKLLEDNTEITVVGAVFEYANTPDNEPLSKYASKENGKISVYNFLDDPHSTLSADWYQKPKKLNKGIWSMPYIENNLKATYSKPFYKTVKGEKKLWGVLGIVLDLEWLKKTIDSIKLNESGYAFIIAENGDFIVGNFRLHDFTRKNIFELSEKNEDNALSDIAKKMTSGQDGFEKYYSPLVKKQCYITFSPITLTAWSLGIVVPEQELFYAFYGIGLKLTIVALAGYIICLSLVFAVSRKITRPIKQLSLAVSKVGQGDFYAIIPEPKSEDEVSILSRNFIKMQKDLINYTKHLQETTIAKERIEGELSIAREIQLGLLPTDFTNNKGIELYAFLNPAKEVGGDIYDFFFIDETHFCFAIGDVSGKGIPAALYMTMVKTLIRAKANNSTNPAQIVKDINIELCKDNRATMFVTLILAIIDMDKKSLSYCSAGHNTPLISAGINPFIYDESQGSKNQSLGFFPDAEYRIKNCNLSIGDTIFLYTDGVTEAFDKNNTQYGEERLLVMVNRNKENDIEQFIKNILADVQTHSAEVEQSDDIAMMGVRLKG